MYMHGSLPPPNLWLGHDQPYPQVSFRVDIRTNEQCKQSIITSYANRDAYREMHMIAGYPEDALLVEPFKKGMSYQSK